MQNLANLSAHYERSADLIASFVECVEGKVKSFEGHERRSHARYIVAIPSIVQPLNEEGRPEGRQVHAVTRDISIGGLGLICTRPVTAKFCGVALTAPNGRKIQLLVKVLRCRPLGSYFDIAGEFVTDAKQALLPDLN